MDKQAKLRFIGISVLLMFLFGLLVYALGTGLESPIEGYVDDDGYLDLRGKCTPTSANNYDGTTSFNITNATLYSNVDGTWKANKTLHTVGSVANATYYFNFTNYINQSAEGTYQWNIQCNEHNTSNFVNITKSFGTNRTITVTYANPSITAITPIDNSYDFDGHEISGSCTVSPSSGWNITSVSLMTNIDGSWIANQTYTLSPPEKGDVIFNFTINKYGNASIADGTDLLFSCSATQTLNNSQTSGNEPLVVSEFSFSNRTINIEYPPQITLNSPADAGWNSSVSNQFSFTPVSAFTTGTRFYCQLKSNQTGTWATNTGSFSATNNTAYTFNYQFQELSDIRWGIYCQEGIDANIFNWSVNRTIRIDRTTPTITLNTPATGTYHNSIPNITYTVTDAQVNSCYLFINDTLNITERTLFTNFTIIVADDGVYTARVGCNDSANNRGNSSSILFTLDTVIPKVTAVGNASVSGSADQRLFNLSANEEVNVTIFYGTTIGVTSNQGNSNFHSTQNITIGGFLENTVYYWNITACDRAGNCNNTGESYGQFDVLYPWKLRTGWSYYGIYDAIINFSYILNQTEAEYVYYWNQTNQEWVSATAGGSTNMDFEVGTATGTGDGVTARHVVVIYEETNSTWNHGALGGIVRNTTYTSGESFYHYNFTTGDNFIKLVTDYSFGNLSLSLFNNSFQWSTGTTELAGYSFGIEESQTPEGLPYNITDFWFSAYNNSGVTWEPYYVYNMTLNNNTAIRPASVHEVVWIWSDYNLTWNGTNIIGNWTY